jgi:hypothetical protein
MSRSLLFIYVHLGDYPQVTVYGEAEAHLIALACSEAPEGQERWTLRLLRDRMIQLEYVGDVSHETIGTTLKKTNLSLG